MKSLSTLPKDRSSTKSSRSPTSDTPIQFVKGVGPRLGAVFRSRGIETVRDLLFFFPRAYEDRSKLLTLKDVKEGVKATIPVSVIGSRKIPTRSGRTMLEVRTTDEAGVSLLLKWFNTPRGMESRFAAGTQIIVTGTVKVFSGRQEMTHPEITWNLSAGALTDTTSADVGRVVPVYVEIEGVPSRTLRKVLWEALETYGSTLSEDLPPMLREKYRLPPLAQAVRQIHYPSDSGDIVELINFSTPAHARLIYEEFLKFEYLVLRNRERRAKEHAPAIGQKEGKAALEDLKKSLPFTLTGDQSKAITDILSDLARPHPMNRLVQGDVGSGKTAVAFLTAGCVLAEGGQAALMAPTEILAEQHYRNALRLFGTKLRVELLTGKTSTAERAALLPKLKAGEPILLIGTHALIEDPVVFANLVFVLIDEQHRFGVEQRRALRSKGIRIDVESGQKIYPHSLVLTATPIPRTLALTAYGDLSVSTIQELPPGRSPVRTHVVREASHRNRAYQVIRDELAKGHQAYFIYPLVNDSEAEGFTSLKSAVSETDRLQTEVFPDYKVGLLHGQMKPDEKNQVMQRFKSGDLHVLVSTTVVEVGVDVPNATIMVIEHSERFGLSQLHQLRGRVGRGAAQSWCFLFASRSSSEATPARLEVLEETNDGFKIAEADLSIRGPGEFLGTRQAGGLAFKLANLVRDQEWLFKAREDAEALLRGDPNLSNSENLPLRRYFEREGKLQADRLKTS